MWCPTHVQVTVQKARGLISKGKNGTNDAFVTIGLGKEKFQTSIKEKSSGIVEWHEKCELLIPNQGNRAEIVLTALHHHNLLGVDEFLGRVAVPLNDMDVYERPKNKWYKLGDKPGKEKNKERGELEVKIAFIVKAGSLSDLTKKEKHKSSLGQLSQAAQSFGGSLISISSLDKRKGLKKFATKIGNKLGGKSASHKKSDDFNTDQFKSELSKQTIGEADPGVISEDDDDFALDELSHKSSGCSINVTRSIESIPQPIARTNFTPPPAKPPRSVTLSFSSDTSQPLNRRSNASIADEHDEPPRSPLERIIIGKEVTRSASPVSNLNTQVLGQYSGKSREELIHLILELQGKLNKEIKKQRDLEDYLDQLLLRVMETSPRILQNPYIKNNGCS